IPVIDDKISNLNVKVVNNNKEIINKNVSIKYELNLDFSECENEIILETKNYNPASFFVLENIGNLLEEGELIINLSNGNELNQKFQLEVFWFNKPFSLNNPDFAIKILKHI